MRISLFLLLSALAAPLAAENAGSYELRPQAAAGTQGILLSDLIQPRPEQALPMLVLAPAPQIGRPILLSRAQINDLIGRKAPELICTNWLGADRVRVVRSTRVLNQSALAELLTATLQTEQVRDRGELELRFLRPWNSIILPDEPLSLKIVELPTSGVSPNFICRFEIVAGSETVGTYQQVLQARVWKEVLVAGSNLMRGQLLREADLVYEKRDLLTTRDYLTSAPTDDPYVELRENLQAGAVLTTRALRLRAIIKRGRQVEAMFQDSALSISVRAEALEDGVPGQIVRLRNVQSRREFKGKVQDEQTVLVLF
jgi:flagella basal body P-ring formation protein FlgA